MYLMYFTCSLNTTLFVSNHQQHVSAITAVFGLKTILPGNIYCSATNVTDEISSCIHLMYHKT